MRRKNEFSDTTIRHSDTTFKSLIIKMFLILVIIIILIWLIPKFFLYKNTKKHEEIVKEKTVVVIKDYTVNNLENAGIKYFNGNNVPKTVNEKEKVSLKELQDSKLIGTLKNDNATCDAKNSYVELTKNKDDYVLVTKVYCNKQTRSKTTYLNNYSYCAGNYLCIRDEAKQKEIEQNNKNLQVPNTAADDDETKELTEFGPWINYKETSCDRQEIKCDINNTNCLREVRVEVFKELVDSEKQIYKDVCYSSERTREYK